MAKDNTMTYGIIALGVAGGAAVAYYLMQNAKAEELKSACLKLGGTWDGKDCWVDNKTVDPVTGKPTTPTTPTNGGAAPTYLISGQATDNESGQNIEGATAMVTQVISGIGPPRSWVTKTDKNGRFNIPEVPKGRYNFKISKEPQYTTNTQFFDHVRPIDMSFVCSLTPKKIWTFEMPTRESKTTRYYEIWFATPPNIKRNLIKLDYYFELGPPRGDKYAVYIAGIDSYTVDSGGNYNPQTIYNLHTINLTKYSASGTITPKSGAGYVCHGIQFRYLHPGLTFEKIKATMYFQ